MIHLLQNSLNRVFAATHPSLDPAPSDWQSGVSSTAWAPMAAEIQRCIQNCGTARERAAVYTQVVRLLDRAMETLKASRSYADRSPERLAAGGLLQQLLLVYRPLARLNGEIHS